MTDKITIERETLQQVLDAVVPISAYGRVGTKDTEQAALQHACEALRVAMAAQPATVDDHLKCGHHRSLAINSAETGEFLYCDLCDAKSRCRDAETMEEELRAALAAQPAQAQPARLSDDLIAHLWDTRVGDLCDEYPLTNGDIKNFAHAIAAAVVPPGFVVVKDWQPIETVPKDGTWFLAWRRHGVLPLLLRWDKQYDAAEDQYGDHVYHLTAWMPLPPAAKATK